MASSHTFKCIINRSSPLSATPKRRLHSPLDCPQHTFIAQSLKSHQIFSHLYEVQYIFLHFPCRSRFSKEGHRFGASIKFLSRFVYSVDVLLGHRIYKMSVIAAHCSQVQQNQDKICNAGCRNQRVSHTGLVVILLIDSAFAHPQSAHQHMRPTTLCKYFIVKVLRNIQLTPWS